MARCALGPKGRVDEARDALNKTITTGGGSFHMHVHQHLPWYRPEDYEHML